MQLRLVVSAIYSVGFWTVTTVMALKSDTFSIEPYLFIYTTGLGMIFAALKDRSSTPEIPPRKEEP